MTKTKTAWLALSLLASLSAVAAMTAGVWRTPAGSGAPPDEKLALIEPVADTAPQVVPQAAESTPPAPADNSAPQPIAQSITWPQAASSEAPAPEPSPALRGAQLPADPPPAPPETITNISSRRWHDANTAPRTTPVIAQQIKNARDSNSKAEMRVKRSKAAANSKSCTPAPANSFTGLLRKLNLTPRCTT